VASLASTPLSRLLLDLHRERFSGWLSLEHEKITRRLQWAGGSPVRLESNVARDGLVARLHEREMLTDEQRDKIVETAAKKKVPELAVVLALKVLGPKDLFLALRDQLAAALSDCMQWQDGQVTFEPGPVEAPPSALPLDLAALVQRTITARWRPDQVLTSLGDKATLYPRPGERFEELRARLGDDPAVTALLDAFDGSVSTFQAVMASGSPAASAALYVLDALGGLDYTEAATAEGEEKPEAEIDDGSPVLEFVFTEAATSDEAAQGPAKESAKEVNPKAIALRKQVLDLHTRLKGIDLYELLGVERSAKPVEIKRAYLKAAKRLHPDALARLGLDDINEESNAVFAEVTRAHSVLSDADARRAYDSGDSGESEIDANALAQAEACYVKAEVMLRAGNFLGAHELLERSVQLWPEEADYQGALGWALYKKNPSEPERSREHLEKAISLDPASAQLQMRFSVVLRALGDAAGAASAQSRAKAIDPKATP